MKFDRKLFSLYMENFEIFNLVSSLNETKYKPKDVFPIPKSRRTKKYFIVDNC